MEILNGARHAVADVCTAIDKDGQEHLVVVIKATYRIPENDKMPRPLIPPQPIASSDKFVGEPGLSACLYEVDYVRRKAKCDILFDAKAHSPDEQPVTKISAGFNFNGKLKKYVSVVGDRFWQQDVLYVGKTNALPFTSMPLHYGKAFGGTVVSGKPDKLQYDSHPENLIGMGYSKSTGLFTVHGMQLPNLMALGESAHKPYSNTAAVAFSVLSKTAQSRRKYAGTYDEKWQQNTFPFLPEDFDERFYQSAPLDQQVDYPQGGETVELHNMMPGRPQVSFRLPRLTNMPIKILGKDYQVHSPQVVVDTLYFEPDHARFSVVWRASMPIKRRIQDIQTVAVGAICKNWWDAKLSGQSSCSGCAKQRSTDVAPQDCETANA